MVLRKVKEGDGIDSDKTTAGRSAASGKAAADR